MNNYNGKLIWKKKKLTRCNKLWFPKSKICTSYRTHQLIFKLLIQSYKKKTKIYSKKINKLRIQEQINKNNMILFCKNNRYCKINIQNSKNNNNSWSKPINKKYNHLEKNYEMKVKNL